MVRRAAMALAAVVLLVSTMGAIGDAGRASPASASTPRAVYDLALGDSLAAGVGASRTAGDYVSLVFRHELTRKKDLRLVNLSCSGATTTSILRGGGCPYPEGTQLAQAEAFLRSHRGAVAFVTLDVGINNVDGCIRPSGTDLSCLDHGMATIARELPEILQRLKAADAGVRIYGMDYYDPFLGLWPTGAGGRTVAIRSIPRSLALDTLLRRIYSDGGASMADPASMFRTADTAPTGRYRGAVMPEDVSLVCRLTLMCAEGNVHPDDQGHVVLAAAFERVIDSGGSTGAEADARS